MDLLQEINNRFKQESERIWKKISDTFYDATVGLLKEYQKKFLELAKISAASFYLQCLRLLRKHLLLMCFLFFGTMVSAVAAVVVPVAIILATPWALAVKIVCLLLLGSLYIGGTAWVLLMMFSEENWMKISGVQEFLDSLPSTDQTNSKI